MSIAAHGSWVTGARLLGALLGVSLAALPLQSASAQTGGEAVPPAPAAPATAVSSEPIAAPPPQPATAQPLPCFPACRTGFFCQQGQCLSACNPLCPAGQVCTNDGQCVSACNPLCTAGETCSPQGQCVPNGVCPPVAPGALAARQMAQQRRQERAASRARPRLTMGVEIPITIFTETPGAIQSIAGFGVGFGLGIRQHLTRAVGFEARSIVSYSTIDVSVCRYGEVDCAGSETEDFDATTVMNYGGELSLIFGPFGRFYFAPLFAGVYHDYSDDVVELNTVYIDGGTSTLEMSFDDGMAWGGGMRFGTFLGRDDEFDVNASFLVTSSPTSGGEPIVVFRIVGFSYAFDVTRPKTTKPQ